MGKRTRKNKGLSEDLSGLKRNMILQELITLKKMTAHILLLYNLRCLKGCGKCQNAFHQYQYRPLIKISSDFIYSLDKGI